MNICKQKQKLIALVFGLGVFLFAPALVHAGNPFYPWLSVYINSGGTKAIGTASSENGKATAIAYRSGIAGMSMVSNQPGAHRIFKDVSDLPAYTSWDVGSSAWSATPQAAGQDMYVVTETYNPLNSWAGASYVGGSHVVLTSADIKNSGPGAMNDIVIEAVPTPALSAKGATSITIQFAGLKDRDDIAPAGNWNDTVVGYTVYRSANSSTSTPVKLGTVSQNAGGGGTVSYVDSSVTQGVNYYYKLSVNFRWAANTPNPWYETTAQGPISAAMFTGGSTDAVKFVAGPITSNAAVAAGPITVSAYNFASGDVGNAATAVTMNLSSNSGGVPKFYAYSGGACGNTPVTQVTIAAGQQTASFCYADNKAGTWTVTATPTNGWAAITQGGEVITVGPLHHFDLSLATPQVNGVPFTGVNTITARDAGGNLISSYSTSAAVSTANSATLANASLLGADFTNGVADLTAKNFNYTGLAGSVVFTVTSANGKTGSSTITINPGSLSSIKVRDAVGGAGAVVTTRTMTADNTYSVYAAGYDSSNNYISDISGTWAVTGTLDNTFPTPGSSAIFSPTHAPTSGTFSFDDGAGHTASTGVITVNAGALTSFSLPQTITSQAAGIPFDIGPIKALDAKGNVVTSFAATVKLADTSGTITPVTSGTFVAGQLASQLVTLTKAQDGVTVTATDTGSAKTGSTNSFAVTHGTLHHFTLNIASPQVNGRVFTGTSTITAHDQWNNVLLDYGAIGSTVTLTVTSSAALQNNILPATDFVNGVADVTAKAFKYQGNSGNVQFTATGGAKTGVATIFISPGDVSVVVIRNAPNNGGSAQGSYAMQVGQGLALYAAGYDVSGNYISEINGYWTRTNNLDAPIAGLANAINYQPMTAYTNGTIKFDDGAGHTAVTGMLTVDRGPLDHFQLNFAATQTDGVPFKGVNNIIAKDVGNNTITDYNAVGTDVTITATSSGATLTNNIIPKSDFAGGIASLTTNGFTYIGTAGIVSLTATAAVTNKSASTNVTINIGTLDHFVVSLSPSQMVNTPFTGVNTITAKDIGNNTVTDFNALVDNVTVTASPVSASKPTGLGGPTGNMLVSNGDFVNGVASVAGKLAHPGPGGSYTFTATSATGKKGDSTPVEIDVGPLHHFGFQIVSTQHAGQSFGVVIIAYAQDPEGNNYVKSTYNGSVALADTSGTVLPATIGPFINGQANATLTITKSMIGNVLHVVDNANSSIVGSSNAFDVLSGALHHFSVSQTIVNQTAGLDFDIGRVEARDQWENVVTDFNAGVDIAELTGTMTVTGTPALTNGVLSGLPLKITKIKTGNVITVSYQGKQGASNPFNVNPGSLAHIILSDQAGGLGSAVPDRILSVDDTLTIFAVGYDTYDNYISEIPGVWGATGNIDAPTAGNLTSIVYAPTHAPGVGTITFNDGQAHAGETGIITIKHGALVGFSFSIGNSQQVGVILTASSTLTALDGKGNTVTDFNANVDNVTISASTGGTILGLGAGNNNILNTAPSFVSGVADLHDLGFIYAGTSGLVTLQAASASTKGGTSVPISFAVGPLDHFNLSFPGVQKNAVSFTTKSTVTAVDMGNNTLTSFDAAADSVAVSVSPGDGVITGLSGSSTMNLSSDFLSGIADVTGKFTFIGKSGPHIFKALSTSGKEGASAQIEILPGILHHLQIRNATGGGGGIIGNQSLNAGDLLQLYAAGYDQSDNFIQDQTVSWIGTGVAATYLSPVNGSNTTFNATIPGTGVIFASSGDIYAQTGTMTVNTGAPAKLIFLTSPYDGGYSQTPLPPHANNAPLFVGKASGPMTVQAQDVAGNVVTVSNGLSFGISSTGSGSFSLDNTAWSNVSNINIPGGASEVTFYYQDSLSGSYTVTCAPADGRVANITQPVVVSPVYDKNLVFTSEQQSIKAGVLSGAITVELRDSDGLATSSDSVINVSLVSNSPGTPKFYFDPGASAEITSLNLQPGNSSITFYYKDTAAGIALLHVISQGVTDGYQLITVTPDVPAKLLITPGPTAQDGQKIYQNYSSDKITVRVLDTYGNTVPVTSNTTIHLSSANALTGSFAGDSTGGAWQLTAANPVAIIPAGKSEAYFYYRDGTLGEVPITATAQPENSWTAASQIETIYAPVISKLAFITAAQRVDTNVASPIITVQAQDALGNAIPVAGDIPLTLLTSDTAGGAFALSAGGPWDVKQLIIPTGLSSVSFYYKDSTPGIKNLGVSETPSLGWADAVQSITINAGLPAKLAFISAPQTIGKNSASGALIVQLQDKNGFPTVFPTDLTIDLRTDSAGGSFTANSLTGPWGIGSVTLLASSSQAIFYYRDQLPGTYNLTATIQGHSEWTATQLMAVTEGVIRQISFITAPQSLPANGTSGIITIQSQNDQGDPVAVTSDTTVIINSSSPTGQFAIATSSAWGVTRVVIPAGSSKTDFYYKDSSSGTFILTATESPTKNWTPGQQQIIIGSVENVITKLVFTSAPQIGANAISGGDLSGKITVQTRSSLDNPVNVTEVTYLVVNSASPTGRFTPSPSGTFSNSLVLTLQPGQNSADFYYTDTIQGFSTLTVAKFPNVGWTDATQPVEIKSGRITRLAFLTDPQSILKDTMSGIITIQTRDVYGNSKAVDNDSTVNISSISGTGSFYQDAVGSGNPITSVVIPANSNSVSFYYKDATAGTYQITADETPDQSWVAASQSLIVTEAQLNKLIIQPDYALLPTETTVQMTAIAYNSSGQALPNVQVDWQVANPAVGTLSNDGVLKTADSLGAYKQVVQATANGMSAYATVEVYKKPVATITTTTIPGETTTVYVTTGSSGGGGGTVTVKAPSQPPVNALVIINDGATETTTAKVNLSLYATGASYMKISQDPTFADAGKWLPYQTSYDLTLTGGLGKKTVYVKYQSAAGDESAVASATINYVEVKVKPPVATSTPPAPQGQPVTPGQPAPVVQPGGVQPPPASTPQGGVVPPVTYVNRIIRNYNYIILHQPNALPPQLPIVVSPAPNSFVLQNALTITGQAPPNTIVTLHIHSPQAVEVKVVTDANGNFVYKLDETVLSAGDHQVYASVDQPDSSLVGPAIDFALLSQPQPAVPAKITAPIVTAFNFQLDLRVWWWLLAIWLFFMIVIFFGFGRLLVYIKANSRINLGFLSRVPTWQILSLLAAIMLIILGVVGILIWR